MEAKKKVVTVEVKTKLNNNDLKSFVRNRLSHGVIESDEAIKVVQVQVNMIKPDD